MHFSFQPPLPMYAGYAETHFRFFPGFPSLLYRRWPEAVFDMPRRLAPGYDTLPVVLTLNDIDRYPVALTELALTVSCGDGRTEKLSFGDTERYRLAHPLETGCAVYLLPVPRERLHGSTVHINGGVVLRRGKRTLQVLNDNLPGSSRLCMSCHVAEQDLPGQDLCAYGDMHLHTQFSESHVEFGVPVGVVGRLAGAYGLDFVCLTDHSYDLACSPENYLVPDPGARRWSLLREEAARWGSEGPMLLVGEEVSCLNARNKVVHLCAVGIEELIPGTLDGARRGRRRDVHLHIQQAVENIHAQGGIAYAAHPGARAGLLQSALLARGTWSLEDLATAGLDGVQGINGAFMAQWRRARKMWVDALARGVPLPLLAGNDAHGDFNRYRCIGRPFLSLSENMFRHAGYTRTGVYGCTRNQADILHAVRAGKTFVTSGPYCALTDGSRPDRIHVGNSLDPEALARLTVHCVSTPEYGGIVEVIVLGRPRDATAERVVFQRHYPEQDREHEVRERLPPESTAEMAYMRAECRSVDSRGKSYVAVTSPVYAAT